MSAASLRFRAALEAYRLALAAGSTDAADLRAWANRRGPFVDLLRSAPTWADEVLETRAIPPKRHKGVEMAVRATAAIRRNRIIRDDVAWFRKNERHLDILAEAVDWPERSAGTDAEALFPFEGFEVHNTIGASGKSLEDTKAVIARAAQAVRSLGAGDLLYGPLFLVGQVSKRNHAAWYTVRDDQVFLRPQVRGSSVEESAKHLIHELGHRYWARRATPEVQHDWIRHDRQIHAGRVELTIPEVGAPLNIDINRKPAAFGGYEGGKALILDARDGSRIGLLDRVRFAKWLREVQQTARFPTAYAATNHEEHFCEAFALAALGNLTGEHAEAFERILKPTRTASVGLEGVVADFLQEQRLECSTADGAFGRCMDASRDLWRYLVRHGFDAEMVEVADLVEPYDREHLHPDWAPWMKQEDRKFLSHTAVRAGDYVIDLTARQFDRRAPFPLIEPVEAFEARWRKRRPSPWMQDG